MQSPSVVVTRRAHAFLGACGLAMVIFMAVGSAPVVRAAAQSPTPTPSALFGVHPAQEGRTTLPGGHFNFALVPGQKIADAIVVENFSSVVLRFHVYGADLITALGGGLTPAQPTATMRAVGAWIVVAEPTITIGAHGEFDRRIHDHRPSHGVGRSASWRSGGFGRYRCHSTGNTDRSACGTDNCRDGAGLCAGFGHPDRAARIRNRIRKIWFWHHALEYRQRAAHLCGIAETRGRRWSSDRDTSVDPHQCLCRAEWSCATRRGVERAGVAGGNVSRECVGHDSC